MTTAATKVFDTAELLEAVLLQLPPRDLLLTQRVNTAFKASIDRSVHIQRKLFFKPNEVRPDDETGLVTVNPFLLRVIDFVKCDPETCDCCPLLWEEGLIYIYEKIFSLDGKRGYVVDEDLMDDKYSGEIIDLEADSSIRIYGGHTARKSEIPHGSWRKMLVSDPPTCRFSVFSHTDRSLGDIIPGNMGELVDFIYGELRKRAEERGELNEKEDDAVWGNNSSSIAGSELWEIGRNFYAAAEERGEHGNYFGRLSPVRIERE